MRDENKNGSLTNESARDSPISAATQSFDYHPHDATGTFRKSRGVKPLTEPDLSSQLT